MSVLLEFYKNKKDVQAFGFPLKMPDIGEGIAEGEIVKIDIKVGDTPRSDDILFEVSTNLKEILLQ